MTDTWQVVGKQRGPNISFIIDYSIELDELSNIDDYPFEQTVDKLFLKQDITNSSLTNDCFQTERLQSYNNKNIYNIRILSSHWISILYIKNIHPKLFNMDLGCITNFKREKENDKWITTWKRLSDSIPNLKP